jgi:hypothetical protein
MNAPALPNADQVAAEIISILGHQNMGPGLVLLALGTLGTLLVAFSNARRGTKLTFVILMVIGMVWSGVGAAQTSRQWSHLQGILYTPEPWGMTRELQPGSTTVLLTNKFDAFPMSITVYAEAQIKLKGALPPLTPTGPAAP